MRNLTGKSKGRVSRGPRTVMRLYPGPPTLTRTLPVLDPLQQVLAGPHPQQDMSTDRWCRLLNIVVATVGLIATLPLLIIIAVLVRVTSPGPVLFTQLRVGLDRRRDRPGNPNFRRRVDYGGRLFAIYKFRTMRVAVQESQVWARRDDPRVTPIGRILRKYRLDELPQLINVLKGDMNIVGPRPEQPVIFTELRKQVHHYAHRQRVLPGITGWAQINQAYDTTIEDVQNKVRLDLEYIARRSWVEDLRIMCLTLPVMIFRRGGW